MEERRTLESWKEISDYLQRSIKTCQRWEMELGLPIHRLDGTPSARVFAYPEELDIWKSEKLNHPEVKAKEFVFVRRQRKKWVLAGAGTVILISVIAIFAWRFFNQAPVSFSSPSTNPNLLFLPLENVTGDQMLEPWRMTLPFLLDMDMIESRVIGVGRYYDLCFTLKDLQLLDAKKFSAEDMKKIVGAWPWGMDYYLATGSLIKSGNDILVNLFLHDSNTGEVIHSLRTACQGESGLFTAVDELTKKIKLALNVPPRLVSRDIDEDVSKIATNSPEALKLYWLGVRLHMEGKGDEAVASFRKATEIDSEFALAYFWLYIDCRSLDLCCGTPGTKDEAIRSAKRALEFSDRLDISSRREIISDLYIRDQKNIPMAIAEYKKLLARWSDIFTAAELARVYWDQEEYDQAVVVLENTLEKMSLKEVPNPNVIALLADCYIRTGDYDKAERILEDCLTELSFSGPEILYLREICALNQRKFEEADTYNDRILASFPRLANSRLQFSKAPLFITQDDFVNAEAEIRRVIGGAEKYETIEGILNLSGLYLTQGKLEEAKNQARLAIGFMNGHKNWQYKKRCHFLLACLERISGNLPEALEGAEKACPCYKDDDVITDQEKKQKTIWIIDDIYCLRHFQLRALINLEMGRMKEFDSQLAEIKKLIDQSQHPILMRAYYYLLGQRELREKNFDKAIDYFWKVLNQLPSPYGHEENTEKNALWVYNVDMDSAQYYYSLAEAYFQAERCRSALDFYKKVPPYWEQRINSGDLYARSFYKMAKIYDGCGRPTETGRNRVEADKALAIENYRKFLSLWRDADPIFAADVEDAKGRLAALEAE